MPFIEAEPYMVPKINNATTMTTAASARIDGKFFFISLTPLLRHEAHSGLHSYPNVRHRPLLHHAISYLFFFRRAQENWTHDAVGTQTRKRSFSGSKLPAEA